MEAMYHDISQWSPWSLERTRDILHKKFPSSAIWLIRPHTLLRHLFSCYHNFVDSTIVGKAEEKRENLFLLNISQSARLPWATVFSFFRCTNFQCSPQGNTSLVPTAKEPCSSSSSSRRRPTSYNVCVRGEHANASNDTHWFQ